MITIHLKPSLGGNYYDGDGTTEATAYRSFYWLGQQKAATLSSATEDCEVLLYAGEDVNGNGDNGGVLTIANTSATARTLTIRPATPADQHTGQRGTGYRHPTQWRLTNNNPNVQVIVEGVAARNIGLSGALGCSIDGDALASFDGTVAVTAGILISGGTVTVKNSISVDSLARGIHVVNNASAPVAKLVNATSVGAATYGISRSSDALAAINCYSGGSGTDDFAGTMTRTACMHSSATSFSGSTGNIVYSAANFTSVTPGSEDLHLVSGSALIGQGEGPGSNANVPTKDFEGDTRSGATTDVGFDQLVSGDPTITDASDEVFTAGETGVVVSGTLFGATQGTGKVYLSPTNDVDDVGRVEQTVTAWAADSVTITVQRGALPWLTQLYLFVVTDGGLSNANGYAVQIVPRVFITESCEDMDANPVALDGDVLLVWYEGPTAANPNPGHAVALGSLPDGQINVEVPRNDWTPGDPLWIALFGPSSPYPATAKRVVPTPQ